MKLANVYARTATRTLQPTPRSVEMLQHNVRLGKRYDYLHARPHERSAESHPQPGRHRLRARDIAGADEAVGTDRYGPCAKARTWRTTSPSPAHDRCRTSHSY